MNYPYQTEVVPTLSLHSKGRVYFPPLLSGKGLRERSFINRCGELMKRLPPQEFTGEFPLIFLSFVL